MAFRHLGLVTASEYCVGLESTVTEAKNYLCGLENLLQVTKFMRGYRDLSRASVELGEVEGRFDLSKYHTVLHK